MFVSCASATPDTGSDPTIAAAVPAAMAKRARVDIAASINHLGIRTPSIAEVAGVAIWQ
jgi:hypothetical protein